jgi:Peptidase family M28
MRSKFSALRMLIAILYIATLASCTHLRSFPDPNIDELRADIAYLSSPEMAGRAPGDAAQDAVSGFLIDRMEQAGLSPAFAVQPDAKFGGWAQPVTLFQRTPQRAELQFKYNGKVITQPQGRLTMIGIEPSISANCARILFLGRGNAALVTKYDLSNTVVLLNAAPNETERAEREALLSNAGAIGVIELARGGDAYQILAGEINQTHFFQPTSAIDPVAGMQRAGFSAVMGEERAVALVTQSGADWDKLLLRSSLPGFSGEWLKATVDVAIKTDIRAIASHNVGGVLKGRKPGSGAVVFIAHWDHLGHCIKRSGLPDIICPGAIDNASGIAAMLQIAERLAERTHDRDIYFIATTGEEHGFIGARTLLKNGPVPSGAMVGIFNLDMVAITSAGAPVAIVGWNGGPFDTAIAKIVRDHGLRRSENPLAETFLKRQDGWVFLNAGLPARMVNSSYGDEWALKAFLANGYHSPSDRYSPTMELGGAAQDIRLHIALGHHFADTGRYPMAQR